MRRSRPRAAPIAALTLGDFLAAASKQFCSALLTPGKRQRGRPPSFSTPRRGRSASSVPCKAAGPPTAERRAQVHILRTLGIVRIHQRITGAEMQTYDGLFATPLPTTVLAAIAALVDRELPSDPATAPITTVIAGSPIEA
ncbi:hypothetical protein ZWY2020_021881 [Hordeum vulgare]|nr:hypothetical protein ZWY2020_021881 [Hordeum vulgare]